ncbi:MAG: DNA polymerase III subunit beta [Alphaproteobacteria bacterium GM202ARS2]|nr:DNA polymerase III subunit beta [Alphaproteobacteria bacterium GM202ARS2]
MAETSLLRFEVATDALRKVLDHLVNLVEVRSTIRVNSHVLLDCQDGNLTLTATDTLMTASESLPASTSAQGRATLPASLFLSIVSRLKGGSQVTLYESEPQKLVLECGRARFELSGDDPELFSPLEKETTAHSFKVPAHELLALIQAVSFAISKEDTRPYLCGLFMEICKSDDDKQTLLRVVGTDGHRMAVADKVVEGVSDDMPSMIIPLKSIQILKNMLADIKGDVAIAFSESQVTVSFEQGFIRSRLIAAEFPNYRKVIPPQDNSVAMIVDAEEFKMVIQRVAAVCLDPGKANVVCTIGQTLSITAQDNLSGGRAQEEIDVDWQGDKDLEKGYNAGYLTHICDAGLGGKLRFMYAPDIQATLIVPQPAEAKKDEQEDGESPPPASVNAFYVLMPTRV